jgi:very-short-patch-repair endonuclease
MRKKKTLLEFIIEANKIHNNKYDYSKVEYKGNHIKVCIICPEHGEFWQTPAHHLMGVKCPKCSLVQRCDKQKMKFEDFLQRGKEIHNNKYDYSKVEYINALTKVCIICPEHGEFWQTPNAHLNCKQGCQKCKGLYKKTTEEFITNAKKIHGDKYDYSKVEYNGNKIKVCIICPEHGEFWQRPNDHLKGCGCSKCNISKIEREIKELLENEKIDFIYQARKKDNHDLLCLGRLTLDFYLPKYKIAIECQGIQHFYTKNFFTEECVKKTHERDKRKFKICKENGILLLYYSNLNIDYPYDVIKNKNEIIQIIKGKNYV